MNSFSSQEQLCLTLCLKSSLLTQPRIPNRGGRKGEFLFAAINSTPEPLANMDPLLRPLHVLLQHLKEGHCAWGKEGRDQLCT